GVGGARAVGRCRRSAGRADLPYPHACCLPLPVQMLSPAWLMPLNTVLARSSSVRSPLYSTPLTACLSAACSSWITVRTVLFATPKAAPLEPTFQVLAPTPPAVTVKPYGTPAAPAREDVVA